MADCYVYIITNNQNNRVYIGQTARTIPDRWRDHVASARRLAASRLTGKKYYNIRKSALYNAMVHYGIHNFRISALATVPLEELNDAEVSYIAEYDSVVPNGYNLQSGGGAKSKHSAQSIELMKERKFENADKHRNPMIAGMPPHVRYLNPANGIHEGIAVNRHPLCKHKVFYLHDYADVEELREDVRTFIRNLEESGIEHPTKTFTRKKKVDENFEVKMKKRQEGADRANQEAMEQGIPVDTPANQELLSPERVQELDDAVLTAMDNDIASGFAVEVDDSIDTTEFDFTEDFVEKVAERKVAETKKKREQKKEPVENEEPEEKQKVKRNTLPPGVTKIRGGHQVEIVLDGVKTSKFFADTVAKKQGKTSRAAALDHYHRLTDPIPKDPQNNNKN